MEKDKRDFKRNFLIWYHTIHSRIVTNFQHFLITTSHGIAQNGMVQVGIRWYEVVSPGSD